MKYFFLFNINFLEVPREIIHRLHSEDPTNKFMGLVSAPEEVYKRVHSWDSPEVRPLWFVDEHHQEWMKQSCDQNKLEEYEEKLGVEAINRILIADRQIANGFVLDACQAKSKMMKLCRENENIRKYITGLLDYVFEVFEKYKPDVIFCFAVAGSEAVALSEVAKLYNVEFFRLQTARISDKYLVDDSSIGQLNPVRKTYVRAKNNELSLKGYESLARQYIEEYRSQPEKPDYSREAHKNVKKFKRLKNILKLTTKNLHRVFPAALGLDNIELKRCYLWSLGYEHLKTIIKSWIGIKYSLFKGWEEVKGKKFAYLPLHVSPEASTSVLAPMYTNQLAFVEAVAKSLPLSMELLVKEHIPMIGKRPSGFYKSIASMPKVTLIDPGIEPFSIIKNSELVITITGTTGWEAMLLGRNVLHAGKVSYDIIDGGNYCETDFSKFSEAIRKTMQLSKATDKELVRYVAAVFKESFSFPSQLLWGEPTQQEVKNNPQVIESICEGIKARINAGKC